MFKLSELFNPINYNAPILSPQVKEYIFSVIDEKSRRWVYFKKLRTILIPIGSTFVLGFIVANNMNYFNIWKPVEVYVKSVNTQKISGKIEIVATVAETGDTWMDIVALPPKDVILKNKPEAYTMKKITVEKKPAGASDLSQISQIMKDSIQKDTALEDPTLDDLEAVIEIETQLTNSLEATVDWQTYKGMATAAAPQNIENPDLIIAWKSSVEYYETKIRNNIYVKNIWWTLSIWTVISVYCYKDAIDFSFSKTLTSDLINWWELLIKKDVFDSYALSVLFWYFEDYWSVDLTCIVNKKKAIEEKNYNNNENSISIVKTF